MDMSSKLLACVLLLSTGVCLSRGYARECDVLEPDAVAFEQARSDALDFAARARGNIMGHGQLTYDEQSVLDDAIWDLQMAVDEAGLQSALASIKDLQDKYTR